MENALHYMEEHPWLAGGLILGAVFILLWLLGFFGSSSSSSSSDSSGTNLAAAYYNAEAAQTTAATNLQAQTEYDTAQVQLGAQQANAATAIATAQDSMYSTLGQQSAGAETALGNDQLLATENSNDDAVNMTNAATYYNYLNTQTAAQASEVNTALGSIVPQELALSGGFGNFGVAGQTLSINTGAATNIAGEEALGYSAPQPLPTAPYV